ncbi:hypothetical protein PCC6912_22290 [Chlorogloeopsis fritschii PCC 6912]|uniref:Uncharacterized protein n=1 Tax=Chlorogloeopsis fritschii PCC 6912 TaxID=211165 RepID=A0A433NKR9_CHLFR|nr:hypothetical protein PCC6912_22290 [Chlorogloeopsis fritschii PCC 6912]
MEAILILHAAIVGGIIGSAVGKLGIPQNWLNNLCEYPRTVKWIESLGEVCVSRYETLRTTLAE